MVTHLHEKFYRSNAIPLSEADIKEIRESRGRIPNASKIMAEKFHVGARRIYEIWNNSERLQQGLILSSSDQPALNKYSNLISRNRLLKQYHLYPFQLQRFQKRMVEKRRLK